MASRRTSPVVEADAGKLVGTDVAPDSSRRPNTVSDQFRAQMEVAYSQRSRTAQGIVDRLTAAAEVMDPLKNEGPMPNAVSRTWQHAVYGYSRVVPELGVAGIYVGNCLSRCRLKIGKRNPDGSIEETIDHDAPEADGGVDPKLMAEAEVALAELQAVRGGQSELLRSYGEKDFLCGEAYLVQQLTPSGNRYDCLSVNELMREGNRYSIYYGPGYAPVLLDPTVKPIRIWRPDAQYGRVATSSVRSCVEILEELAILTRLVRASAISRMALSGILAIAEEFDTPQNKAAPDGNQSEEQTPFFVDMVNTGAKAIDDPASAAAWSPFLLVGPRDLIEHGIKYIKLAQDDNISIAHRDEALQRLAQGLDLPVEVIMGHQCVDDTTEILTATGWRRHDQLGVGTEVLTLNHDTGLTEWQPVDGMHRYQVTGHDMVQLTGKMHSSLTTTNHRWPVITQRGMRAWRTSEDLGTAVSLLPAAPHADLPADAKHADALVELVAWYWTEGTDHATGSVTISQSARVNPQHVAAIRRCLWDLVGGPVEAMHRATRRGDAAWRDTLYGDVARFSVNKVVADRLRELAPGKMPTADFLRSLTLAQMELFIQRTVDADGWRHPNGYSFQLHQADPERAAMFEFACILSGRAVSTRHVVGAGGFTGADRYLVTTRKAVPMRVGYGIEWQRVRYTGTVWCPTVANATWLARRNGKVFFTGNSTTFANAAQVSEDTYKLHLEPALGRFTDATTMAHLWPTMAKNRYIPPERIAESGFPDDIMSVAVVGDASALVSRPDRTAQLLETFIKDPTQMSVRLAEVRESLGLDPEQIPDELESSTRLDAKRLGNIRETVAAPPSDAAVSLAKAGGGGATKAGESATARALEGAPPTTTAGVNAAAAHVVHVASDGGASLAYMVAGAAEVTLERAVEKVGARLRAKVRGAEAEAVSGVDNGAVAAKLGPVVVKRILARDVPAAAELRAFAMKVQLWASEYGSPDPVASAQAAGQLVATLLAERLYGTTPTDAPPQVYAGLLAGQ